VTEKSRVLWGRTAQVAGQGGIVRRRLIDVAVEEGGAPQSWALMLSPSDLGGVGASAFDVSIGVGTERFEWANLPAPPAGSVYVVHAHNVQVDLHPLVAGTTVRSSGWACPTDLPPTLTP